MKFTGFAFLFFWGEGGMGQMYALQTIKKIMFFFFSSESGMDHLELF